jgi:hypothetical protein
MGRRLIRVTGFEEAIAAKIASSFRFSDPTLSNVALVAGRHVFVDELPECEDIFTTDPVFDADREPTLGIYTKPGPGIPPSVSSGSRLEFNVDILLRFGRTMGQTKDFLGDLFGWVLNKLPGAQVGKFVIRATVPISRPVPFARYGDDHTVASCTIRFLAVPLP